MNNDVKQSFNFKQMLFKPGLKRMFKSKNSDRNKVIEVKRLLTLGDGLQLIPTSPYEEEQI